MGAGRKTFTYDADTQAAAQNAQFNFENSPRQLGEELGGCIFGEQIAVAWLCGFLIMQLLLICANL